MDGLKEMVLLIESLNIENINEKSSAFTTNKELKIKIYSCLHDLTLIVYLFSFKANDRESTITEIDNELSRHQSTCWAQ